MLVAVKGRWGFKAGGASGRPKNDRLRKLAKNLDSLARHDQDVIRRAQEISVLRRNAAAELHGICAHFVKELNGLLSATTLDFDPEHFRPDQFQEDSVNLFQINARGRILQIEFESPETPSSTENFRVPYILEGAIRSFNQQSLEKQVIEEQALFYTLEKARSLWRFFDARTYRSGPVDSAYLTGLMEELL